MFIEFAIIGFMHPKARRSNWSVYGRDYAHAAQIWCWHTLGMLSVTLLLNVFITFVGKYRLIIHFVLGCLGWGSRPWSWFPTPWHEATCRELLHLDMQCISRVWKEVINSIGSFSPITINKCQRISRVIYTIMHLSSIYEIVIQRFLSHGLRYNIFWYKFDVLVTASSSFQLIKLRGRCRFLCFDYK